MQGAPRGVRSNPIIEIRLGDWELSYAHRPTSWHYLQPIGVDTAPRASLAVLTLRSSSLVLRLPAVIGRLLGGSTLCLFSISNSLEFGLDDDVSSIVRPRAAEQLACLI